MTVLRSPGTAGDPVLKAQALGLIGLMGALMVGLGWLWAGTWGVVAALVVAAAEVFLLPTAGPRTIMRMLRARPIPLVAAPDLHALAATLARRAGLSSRPRLFVTPSPAVEAMAVSGDDAADDDAGHAVALSRGALATLTPREMSGVLAHELTHLAAGDVRLFRLVGGMAASVRALGLAGAGFCLVLVLSGAPGYVLPLLIFVAAPLLATLAEVALWRLREYAADDGAVALTGDPLGLASALRRIEALHGNPLWRFLRGLRRVSVPAPLRTHPQTEDRVARLLRKV